ncbi:hypothetical protein B0H11DRAFT_1954872 [Mycena galericulata]|nr:hypothetical protein B0H11DRAFT_1954872 [Mycena galericulata]
MRRFQRYCLPARLVQYVGYAETLDYFCGGAAVDLGTRCSRGSGISACPVSAAGSRFKESVVTFPVPFSDWIPTLSSSLIPPLSRSHLPPPRRRRRRGGVGAPDTMAPPTPYGHGRARAWLHLPSSSPSYCVMPMPSSRRSPPKGRVNWV